MTTYKKKPGNAAFSRREFFQKSGIMLAGIGTIGLYSCFKPASKKELRLIAYNVLKCTGYPSEKMTNKDQMPTLMAKELAKYNPDIINFSESPDESIVKEIALKLKMNYVRFPSAGNWPGTILTHFNILESVNVPIINGERPADLFTRHWGKAKLQLPNNKTIIIHSAHLYPHDTPASGAIRKLEISLMTESITNDASNNNSVILMGDLNLSPDLPEYKQLMNANLVDSFAKVGKGNGFTINADKPSKRIDYIMACGPIADNIIESKPLSEGAFRTNASDSKSFALSDHMPQYAVFRL
jgi:endonuclease/exonuclease/phosphatase family metal-dependent hydrolase